MKKLFERLSFHKMDETERNIAWKAQRNALIYVSLALLIWALYESFKVYTQHTPINLAPCFLLVTTAWVLIFSQLFLRSRAAKGDKAYAKASPTLKTILLLAVVVASVAFIGVLVIIFGQTVA